MNSDKTEKVLFYFTESYPFGISQQWKKNELEVFKNYFSKIIVVPLTYKNNDSQRNLVEGIEYKRPILDSKIKNLTLIRKILLTLSFIFSFPIKFLREGLENGVFFSFTKMKKMTYFCYRTMLLKQTSTYKEIITFYDNSDVYLYYFWGIGSVDAVPFLGKLEANTICKFHGFDLYSERNKSQYIPFQKELIKKLDVILPCSAHGKSYLVKKYPFAKNKIYTARLGTVSKGKSGLNSDSHLNLITCSFVNPIKRLDLICQALKLVKIPVKWTHIGDGPQMELIKNLSNEFSSNVTTNFKGLMESSEILNYYSENNFDLFLNVSLMEGIPVSIMEAFSASIPVYATNVGGTSEIVDETVGKLLSPDITPHKLALYLEEFHKLSLSEKQIFRNNAYARYLEKCNAHINAEKLVQLMFEAK